jgi:hypothetical protein
MSGEVCAPATATLAVVPRDAVKVSRWIEHCAGVAVWGCQDLSDPSRTWYTPARLTDGSPSSPPHWSASRTPVRVITDAVEVEVVEHREARRLRIAVRPGYGLGLVLTEAASRRLKHALADAGEGATYHFEGNEAVVLAEVSRTPLLAWLAEHPDAKAV